MRPGLGETREDVSWGSAPLTAAQRYRVLTPRFGLDGSEGTSGGKPLPPAPGRTPQRATAESGPCIQLRRHQRPALVCGLSRGGAPPLTSQEMPVVSPPPGSQLAPAQAPVGPQCRSAGPTVEAELRVVLEPICGSASPRPWPAVSSRTAPPE